jgi:PPP family 3-phenylpropionic acid transporter
MPSNPQEPAGRRLAQRLALFYASIFLALGVYLPFLPVWLSAGGLDAQTIGIVLAMPMILRLFAIPMATRVADRHDALRAVILAAAAAALVGFAALGMATGTVPIAVLYALAATAFMPLFVLSDVYALRGLADRRAYGPVRIWGSAAFILANVTAGYLLDVIPARHLIWLVVAGMGTCFAAACMLPPPAARSAVSGAPASTVVLWRDPSFIAVGAAASLIQSSHALYYSFSTLDWQAQGFGGGAIGMLWALGVLAEIGLFAASARLPAAFTPGVLILIGGTGALVRWLVMALDPPAAMLPPLQCLHALSFGATHLGTLGYIARAAPAGLAATAQGYLAVTTGLAVAASTGLSGLLYARFGGAAYAAMAVIAAAGVVAAFAANRMLARGDG